MSNPGADFPPLFAELPDCFAGLYDAAAPWKLLGEPLDEVLAALPSSDLQGQLSPEVHLVGDRIVIAAGARIHPNVVIEGPVFIGPEAEIRPGAYIRGDVWIGEKCVVGTNTEVKRAILLRHAKAPHLNYVGDSILGADVNLGAGTILSNFRHDGKTILSPAAGGRLDTGRRKLGDILGDGVLTGCNSVLHPGVVVGRGTQIYPGVQLRPGVYPEKSVVKLRQELEVVARSDPKT
jgi:bifunctional UDP-N-acetylglucosamine pyrophosphorylase/glucosamine-1-phosphate N-acetyltransferase